jgi:two-component system response regulator MprA
MTRVLVVDDEPDILESTEAVLLANGFEVTTVAQADLVLAQLHKVRPEILLQDVNMPGLDLARLVKEIRAEADLKDVRVILFTASDRVEDIREQVGADGYVQKPFNADRIKQVLERFLQRAEAAKP